jgi:hypothetical protein
VRRRRQRIETWFTCPYCSRRWEGPLLRWQGKDESTQALYQAASDNRDAHMEREHHAETIATRMAEVEREAKWATEYAKSQDEELDWATHPLAVEWRALMKAWWALPPQPPRVAALSPTYNRSLLAKGVLAPPTAGERFMSTVASYQRKRRTEAAA